MASYTTCLCEAKKYDSMISLIHFVLFNTNIEWIEKNIELVGELFKEGIATLNTEENLSYLIKLVYFEGYDHLINLPEYVTSSYLIKKLIFESRVEDLMIIENHNGEYIRNLFNNVEIEQQQQLTEKERLFLETNIVIKELDLDQKIMETLREQCKDISKNIGTLGETLSALVPKTSRPRRCFRNSIFSKYYELESDMKPKYVKLQQKTQMKIHCVEQSQKIALLLWLQIDPESEDCDKLFTLQNDQHDSAIDVSMSSKQIVITVNASAPISIKVDMSKLADRRNKAGLGFFAFQFDLSQKDYVCYSLFVND